MMEQQERPKRKYEAISPTAWGVARRRTFTDIPYTKEIFAELEKIRQKSPDSRMEDYGTQSRGGMSPFFEARYLILNKLLKEVGATQIIELAAGLSPRGLEFTRDPKVSYAELEVPEMSAEKEEIVGNVTEKLKIHKPENLHFESGNALEEADIERAASHFDEGREVAIINEGLLRYLDHQEKSKLAGAVLHTLQKFGGCWITPDIAIRERINKVLAKHHRDVGKNMAKLTGAGNFDDNLFGSITEAKGFFENLGFEIEVRSYEEVADELVSPNRLNIDKDSTNELLNMSKAFIMRPKVK